MPRKQNQVDSSTVRKSDSHKTDANHGKIVNKDFSCKHSNKVCNLCVASSVRMSATSQKELFTKSGRYGVAVSSGRCRQRMGWRWRKRGVTLLSTVPQKSSYRYAKSEFHGIKSHTSYTASGIDDAETSEAKCMIVDLAGDSEMDQSDNSSSFSAGLACCSDAKNTQMTSHAKRKSNKNTKLSVQQSVRNSASDMCVKACQGKAAAVLQNNSFSEDFVLLDSSDEVESVSSESIIAVEEDDESESTLVNPSCLRIDRNQQYMCRQFGSRTAVLMKHPCEISVKGKALIQCICGKVSVLGYQIEAGNQKRSIYCPSSASFLTVSTVNDQTVNYNGHFTDCRKLELELKPFLSDYPTVVLLQSFNCHQTDFIMQHDKFNDLYQELAVSNVTPSSVDSVSVPQTLLETGESWLADIKNGLNTTLAVCGGLNTGKSTACRYLINLALNEIPQIAYLECDIGQTEFTVPGCVSLTLVNEPLLGPPFTHQKTTVRSASRQFNLDFFNDHFDCVFVGRLSPASCSQFYVQCLKQVFSSYLRLPSRPPLIVNTMGWMKDVGLCLLVDTLRLTRPGFVIQLCNDKLHHVRHLPMVTSEFLASASGIVFKEADEQRLNYKWIRVSAAGNHRSKSSTYNAACRRELAVLAYFSQTNDASLSLRTAVPYRILWTDVAIHVSHEVIPNSQILYAINGNIVALCSAAPSEIIDSGIEGCPKFLRRDAVCDCLGFGIVRSISSTERALYIITPVAPPVLQKVNCLQLGAVSMPTCLLTSNEPSACTAPYIDVIHKVPKVHRLKSNRTHLQTSSILNNSMEANAADVSGYDLLNESSCSQILTR